MKIVLFSFFTLLFFSSSSAQKYASLDKQFSSYQIVSYDAQSMVDELNDTNRSDFSVLSFTQEYTWEMELVESGIIKEDYYKKYNQGDKIIIERGTEALPMSGYLKGIDDSRVSLTFADGFIYGFIRERSSMYFIEPVSHYVKKGNHYNEFVIYKESDIIPGAERKCGVEEMNHSNDELHPDASRSVGDCYEVEWAIASDGLMFNTYGSVAGVENHNIGVANNVQTNYDDEFADELQFFIPMQYVSTSPSSDPWTSSTNAGALLGSFRSWAPSGFGVQHDIGSLWTDRNFDGSTVGIAYVGVVCTGSRYNCLMDFTSNANNKRVMVSHEIGHNFSANHDPSGSGTIMAPSVNNTNLWSTASINSITAHYLSRTCLASCVGGSVPPVADAQFQVINPCVVGQVQFLDGSTNSPTNWSWLFEGGTPATSNQQNPLVNYTNPGTFSAQLTVTNAAGSDQVVLNQAITIGAAPVASFAHSIFGNGVIFTNTSSGGTDFFWNFGDGNTSQQQDPTHFYAEDGTYTVTLVVLNSCGDNTFTETIVIATPPEADFSAVATTGCEPFDVSFISEASSNTIGWDWQFPGGNPSSSTLENPMVTYDTPGTYDVTLVVINAQGSDQFIQYNFITVDPLPLPAFSTSIDGAEVTFTNTSTESDSYDWDFGDGNSSTDENPIHTYTASGTYTVELTATNACGDITVSTTVMISLLPSAAITTSSATSGCAPLDVSFLDASSNAPDTYLWTFEGGTPGTSTEANPVITYNAPGDFDVTLMVTNASGSDQATFTDYITIYPETTSDFSYNNIGLTVDFIENSTNGLTYSWDFGDGNTSANPNPQNVYASEGIYTVILESMGLCGTDTHTETLNLYTTPSAFFAAVDPSVCVGEMVSFDNQSSDNSTTFNWTFEGGSPASSSDENPTVTYNQSGSFDVTLEVSNPAGTNVYMLSDLVIINDIPQPGFTTINDLLTVDFVNNSTGGNSYSWDFGDGFDSTDENPTHTYAIDGDYTVIQTVTNECGTSMTTQVITVNDLPSASASAVTTSGCGPVTIQFNDQSSSNVTSWNWTFEGGNPATSTDQNPLVEYVTAGIYDVELMVEGVAGSDVVLLEDYIEIYTVPTALVNATVDGNVINLESSSIADTYSWAIDGETLTGSSVSYIPEENGSFEVTLTVENVCGSDTETVSVSIDAYPEVSLTSTSQTVCVGTILMAEDFTVNSNIVSYIVTYDGPELLVESNSSQGVEVTLPGIYDFTLEVQNQYGSNTYFLEDYLTVIPQPTAEFAVSMNGAVAMFSNTSTAGDTYMWDFGDGSVSDEMDPSHEYTASGNYTVTLTVTNECGSSMTSIEFDLDISTPQIDVDTDINSGCGPLEIQYTDNSAGNPTSWSWSFPGGMPETSTDQNPLVTYSEEGIFNAEVEMTNEFGTSSLLISEAVIVFLDPVSAYNYTQNAGFTDFEYVGSMVESYLWNFDDGNISTDQNPSHQFTESGSYDVTLTVTNPCGVSVHTETIEVIISDVNQVDWIQKFSLYPNPNFGQFNLDIALLEQADIKISVIDILGRIVHTETHNQITELSGYAMNLDGAEPGTYMVRMESGSRIFYKKILIF